MALKTIREAAKGLVDAIADAGEQVVDNAKSKVADEVASFVDRNKTKDPKGKGNHMEITAKVPFKNEGELVILPKGGNISVAAAITIIACGIEWDEVKTGPAFDADVSCLLVRTDKSKNEMIYYGALTSKCHSVEHTGDNLTGADDAVSGVDVNEDDETILVNLSKLDADVEKVVFFTNIHDAANRSQNFGTTGTMGARLYNNEDAHIFMEADLMEDNSTNTSMLIGEFYRKDTAWKYKNMAQGGNQTLQEFADSYKA